jgi:hypothetical protein
MGTSSEEFNEDSVFFLYKIVKGASEYLNTTNSTRRYVRRDRNDALESLIADCFDEKSVYHDDDFRGTFRP